MVTRQQGLGPGIPHPVDIHVGNRIRARRRFLGMSLKVLANALGVTLQQVQKYETGETLVTAARLSAIGGSLGVPVSFFFINSQVDNEVAARMARPETIELLRCYHSFANDRVRQHFLKLVKAVAAARKSARTKGRDKARFTNTIDRRRQSRTRSQQDRYCADEGTP